MNDTIKKFLNNASWIMIGRIFQLGLTFITTMLVTRYLGPTKYGTLTYVFSYIQLLIPLCTLGFNDIIVKELVDDRDSNEKILGTMILTRVVSSILSMIISITLVRLLNNNTSYIYIAFLQSFSLLFQSFDCLMYFYQSKLLSKKTGIIYALTYIITAIIRIIMIYTNRDIYYFAFAMSLDYIVLAILLFYAYRKDNLKLSFSFDLAKKLLKKSKYYIFSGFMVVLYGKVTDTLLLGKLVDETSVGFYSAATTLCNAWPFILTAVIDSASPIIVDLYSKDKVMFEKRLKQLYASVFYIGLAVAIFITIFSDLIISIIYGEEYYLSSMPLKIASWNTMFAYIGVSRNIWMQCENKTKYEGIISLFGAIVSILLNYVLIKQYGIIGAAIALTLTQFLTNIVFMFFIKDIRQNGKYILDAIMLKDIF